MKRLLLIVCVAIVMASMIPVPALAEEIGMVSGSEKYGRIESNGMLLEIQNGKLMDKEGHPGEFTLCLEVLSYDLKIDKKGNILIHLMPVGEAAKWLPARGYTEWGYFNCIGPQRKNKPFVGVWGYIASHRVRKHRHGWTEHKYLTAGGQGFACKSRLENDGRTLHIVIYGAIF